MSMTDTRAGFATLPAFYSGQNRSRMSWGAVFAGAVVAVAIAVLLSLLGAAMGAGSIGALDASSTELANSGVGAGIWEIINLALSMALGGYVSARLSGTHSHLDGELHGITMWGLAVLVGSVLVAQTVSGVIGFIGQGASSVASSTIGSSGTVSGALSAGINPQTMVNRLQRSLTSSGDPTTMSREQISSEITALVGKSVVGTLSDSDRNRLVSLVAAQSAITQDEAARRVTQMENDIKANVAQVEQSARAAADTLARDAAIAARLLFTALALGLLAALVGAWIGTRHKRALHLVAGQDLEGRDAGYATRAVYETVGPASVSVYDDAGRLVSQYLRGVSFPVSKQELLRMARSGNAGPGVVHLIENLAQTSFSNTDEVLGALHLAH